MALTLLGPGPLSLCAAMADLPADCVPTPHCQEMGNPRPDATLAAQTDDCCIVSSAPLPERDVNVPLPVVSPNLVADPELTVEPGWAEASSVIPSARSAPVDVQSALCVFLI